jgi:hypothetical protein
MAVFKDVKVYAHGYDLSGDLNACAFEYGADMLDGTKFGHGTRVNSPGLATARLSHEGHWRANGTDAPDDVIFPRIGTANVIATVSPQTGAVGEVAYFFQAVHSEYSLGGAIGDLLPFSVVAEGDNGVPPIRGKILQAAGSVTATGTGTAVEIGAAASGQTLYAALHVFSASAADTLDVVIQSDVDSGFATPVTALTFAQQSAIGSAWASVAGPATDSFYRVSYTVGGTSPDFSFVVVLGVI